MIPLNFPPLVAEAERLAREFNDAQTIGRWTDTGVRYGTDAFARLLADPTNRTSQAWMGEWIGRRLATSPWVVLHTAQADPASLLMRCRAPLGVEPADVLVACVLALHAQET